jgi:GntR family transcriptional regulator
MAAQGMRARMELLRTEECELSPGLRQVFAPDVSRCLYLERLHLVDDVPVTQTCMLPEAVTIAREDVVAVPSYALLERLPG